ncbi:ABC transporter substrate-binding protein [Psychrobacillus soli]|uniref:ABC transporter substrate-binding protein n=1 Tax=Psychrobacillus soli TaxID=1543965 RepID=A0A544TLM1_9BACI|nr:ABC transporter substrate-binding protein [Psychrobacillus soli]TQR18318.1 ABC transporter substrate-binding protein [Psychrobacillus soli]
MKVNFKIFRTLSILCIFLVAGCSDKESDSGNKTVNTTESSKNSTLIYGRGTDTVTLDAHNIVEAESSRISKNIYETLIDYEKESTEVTPKLAKEWTTSDDGLIWTFKLQENVKFHDGTEFNADAVVYNFERMMDENHPQHQGDFSIFSRTFKGVIEEVKAVDAHTVEFKLVKSDATFLPNLGITPFGIISPDALKTFNDKIQEHPVGTGPFVFDSWIQNDSLTLLKNENYWITDLPKMDKIIFKIIPDNSARLTALKNGEIDLMEGINQSDLPAIEKDMNLQILKRPAANVGYITINTTRPPFDNVKVRQALNHAVNKQGLIDAFFGPVASPAKNMTPPAVWGYNDEVKDYEFDLEKAKQLLVEAGYPNGFETEFYVMTTPRLYFPQPEKVAEAMKSDLEKINVKVKIVTYEWATYLPKLMEGDYSIAVIGRISENGDPDNFLNTMLYSKSSSNLSKFSNTRIDELLIEAKNSIDRDVRTALYKEVQEIAHNEAPTIPIAYVESPMAARNYVKGYIPHAIGYESLAEIYFEE